MVVVRQSIVCVALSATLQKTETCAEHTSFEFWIVTRKKEANQSKQDGTNRRKQRVF